MRMEFVVLYADGRKVEAVARPKDVVAFERQYQTSMAAFADEKKPPPMEWMYYLAWSPLHRLRQEPRAFDEFLDDVDEIEVVEEPTAATPFEKTPSPDQSPISPSEPASESSS